MQSKSQGIERRPSEIVVGVALYRLWCSSTSGNNVVIFNLTAQNMLSDRALSR
jgi:hypothetical protein